ncbi:MAG: hypothetical protein HZA02_05665 [Nitrospinae bacterium]|nr:hypothetical protein [Nitrospinota bacterium]
MKTTANPSQSKISKSLQKLVVKKKPSRKKDLSADPFFSSPPVDLGRTNNAVIDRILYGKKEA